MAVDAGSKGFLSNQCGLQAVAVALAALAVGVACFMVWQYIRGDESREVGVAEARLVSPKRLELLVDTCHPPQLSLWEREADLRVKAMSTSPSLQGDADCGFTVEFDLQEPLGDRAIVDDHTGKVVNVTTGR